LAKIDEFPRIFELDRLNHFLPFNTQLTLFSSASVRRCQHLYIHTAKLNHLVCLIHSTQCLICLFFVQKEIAAYWEILLRNGHVLFFRKNFINPQKAITILKLLSHRLLYNLEKRPSPRTS